MSDNLEASMKPGKLSAGGFLGNNERLNEVLKADDATVKRLGVTHEQIAARIEYFINAVDYPSRKGKLIDRKYLVGGTSWRGLQGCPWRDAAFMPHSSMDLFVRNKEIDEQLDFPGGIVHLIRVHHFYEGKQSPYRVDPEKAVRVLDVK